MSVCVHGSCASVRACMLVDVQQLRAASCRHAHTRKHGRAHAGVRACVRAHTHVQPGSVAKMAADALHRRSTYYAGSPGAGAAAPPAPMRAAAAGAGPLGRGEGEIGSEIAPSPPFAAMPLETVGHSHEPS